MSEVTAKAGAKRLTAWMIPPVPGSDVIPSKSDIASFNKEFGKDSPVTVLNTTLPFLRDQLISRSPEFGHPDWAMVKSQRPILKALIRFTDKHKVRLNIRFISWAEAFNSLNLAIAGTQKNQLSPPDVAQVGSSWVAYFADQGAIITAYSSLHKNLKWRSLPENPKISLRYIVDLRLLFYWKRLPSSPPDVSPLKINAATWQSTIQSIKEHIYKANIQSIAPIALPLGLTHNLVHDYIPLVWSGGAHFLDRKYKKVNLTGEKALFTPLLLANNLFAKTKNHDTYKIFSFPVISHEKSSYLFLYGRYLATIEPVAFITRWAKRFNTAKPSIFNKENPEASFEDYAGVTKVPGVSWKGGSDLVVLQSTKMPEQAAALATFLASDPVCKSILAEAGHMPSQMEDFGVKTMLSKLTIPAEDKDRLASMISEEIKKAREYDSLAEWPIYMESPEVLRKFQSLWEAIGRGSAAEDNTKQVSIAAKQVELTINQKIHWPTKVFQFTKNNYHILLFVIIIILLSIFHHTRKLNQHNRRIQVAIELLRRRDYVLISRMGAFLSDKNSFNEETVKYFSDLFAEVRDITAQLDREIRKDLRATKPRYRGVRDLINQAWAIAGRQHKTRNFCICDTGFQIEIEDKLDEFCLRSMPYILVVMLQEWFYKIMKICKDDSIVKAYFRNIGHKTALYIDSPVVITRKEVDPFLYERSTEMGSFLDKAGGSYAALISIRKLCRSTFGTSPEHKWLAPDGSLRDQVDEDARYTSVLILYLPMEKYHKKT